MTKQTSLSQISTLKKKEQKNVKGTSEETCQSVSRTVKICRTLQCQKRESDISQLTQRVIATSWVNSIYFPDKFKPLFLIYSQPKKYFKLAIFSQHKIGCPKTISYDKKMIESVMLATAKLWSQLCRGTMLLPLLRLENLNKKALECCST